MSELVIRIAQGDGAGSPAPRPQGERQQRRVFWAKFFLCFLALGTVLQGSVASLLLVPAAAMCWAPTRRWMATQFANLQRRF